MAVPALTAVTKPSPSTVATAVLSDSHVTPSTSEVNLTVSSTSRVFLLSAAVTLMLGRAADDCVDGFAELDEPAGVLLLQPTTVSANKRATALKPFLKFIKIVFPFSRN